MTPLFTSPCDLAERIPAMAADFLELETKIGRRFREDSVTDIIIASLLKVGGSNATVFTPPETKTGGDFDLIIFQPATGDGVQYRIQSKRLIPNTDNWLWGSYRELDYPHGSGRQASTLIRSSAREKMPTIPLYAFYNPSAVCLASKDEILGVQLADGRKISAIVRALVRAKAEGKRPRLKRIGFLQHLFFPLSTILCPPADEQNSELLILQPEASRRAALAAINERPILPQNIQHALPQLGSEPTKLQSGNQKARAVVTLPATHRDQGYRDVPKLMQRAINRQPEEPAIQRARIKRPKLVLLSR